MKNVPRALDAITDAVLAYKPPPQPPKPEPTAWSVSIDRIFSDGGLRLDAAHFGPELDGCLKRMIASGLDLKPLHKLAELALPNRFERVWASDAKHGVPYLNATDLLSLFAIGLPSKERYLSHQSNANVDDLIVRQNWLLMTCSGTLGRVFHVPKRLDGWAATHDLIRIKPNPGMVGYLFAWLMTQAAQTQILSHTHGGQIDHVTDEQVGSMLVPILPRAKARALDKAVLRALKTRDTSLRKLEKLWPDVS